MPYIIQTGLEWVDMLMLLVSSSVTTASIASFVLGLVMVLIIAGSKPNDAHHVALFRVE